MSESNSNLIWGASNIAKFLGRSTRSVFHLLERGHIPARKVGAAWVVGRHAAEQARMAILQATELLPERWRKILALRLVEGRTLIETGEALGVTRERVRQIETKVIERLREALRYDPRALNLIGLDVEAPETVTRADADGLTISDIAYLTGMSAKAVDQAIAARTFPEPARHAYHRGTRLWDPAAVAEWMARRDAASASTAEEPSPGIPAPDAHEAPPAPASAALEPIRAPAEASVPSEPEATPRPSYAPALAHALMGESSLLAVFVAAQVETAPSGLDEAA